MNDRQGNAVSQKLSDALDEVLALMEKATGGELFILWLRNGSIKYPVATTKDRNIFIEASSHQKAEDCRAIIAAINLLRQYGPALAAIVRAVEGDAWQPIETAPKDGRAVLLAHSGFYSPFTGRFEDGAWYDSAQLERTPNIWRPLPPPPLDAADDGRGG